MTKPNNNGTTIDQLARMVAKGFASVDRKFEGMHLSFDGMRTDFQEVHDKLDTMITKKELEEFREEVRAKFIGLGNRMDVIVDRHKVLKSKVKTLEKA